jgi:hypothetical protein
MSERLFRFAFKSDRLPGNSSCVLLEDRDTVMRGLIRAVYRFRDAALIAEKKKISAAPSRIFIGS